MSRWGDAFDEWATRIRALAISAVSLTLFVREALLPHPDYTLLVLFLGGATVPISVIVDLTRQQRRRDRERDDT